MSDCLIGHKRIDDNCYMNATNFGWQTLVTAFGQQLTKLVITDCEIDDKQLDIIVNGFRKLKFLDITGNPIRNYDCLANICDTIEVIKLGASLIHEDYQFLEAPLEPLMTGNGLQIKELHIQGFLTPQLFGISNFSQLNTLVVKFKKVRTLFGFPDSEFFRSLSSMKSLECVELYEV